MAIPEEKFLELFIEIVRTDDEDDWALKEYIQQVAGTTIDRKKYPNGTAVLRDFVDEYFGGGTGKLVGKYVRSMGGQSGVSTSTHGFIDNDEDFAKYLVSTADSRIITDAAEGMYGSALDQ